MKIFKDGQWITPLIDNNINSGLKVFFDGKWNNIILKDDYISNAPNGLQYMDTHKVFIYVQGAWYQIAIEEDIVILNEQECFLTFKSRDMDNYKTNLQIRPDNNCLTALRIASSTQTYEINMTSNHGISEGALALEDCVILKGNIPSMSRLEFNSSSQDDYKVNIEPKYHAKYVEISINNTSSINVEFSKHNQKDLLVVKGLPDFEESFTSCETLITNQKDILINRHTIGDFNCNATVFTSAKGIELQQRTKDTMFSSFEQMEDFEHGNIIFINNNIELKSV